MRKYTNKQGETKETAVQIYRATKESLLETWRVINAIPDAETRTGARRGFLDVVIFALSDRDVVLDAISANSGLTSDELAYAAQAYVAENERRALAPTGVKGAFKDAVVKLAS